MTAITAPRVLDEGIDVPAADLAIIFATTKTRRQMGYQGNGGLWGRPAAMFAEAAIMDGKPMLWFTAILVKQTNPG